jgi:Zn-dependent peptidase ImmA (M78 family)/DNA-binding XRE family transcriptional regulator
MAILRVAVEPRVLAWARKTRGLSLEDAAGRIGVAPTRIQQWEHGEEFPTVRQLRKAAQVYKRAIGLLFLPEPPEEDELKSLRDFRRVPDPEDRVLSPALRLEVRLASERRQEALELLAELGEPLRVFEAAANLTDDPDGVGARIRAILGVSVDTQLNWSDKYVAFNSWRAAIERQGILVFQTGGTENLKVSPREVRGFSIADRPLPVVVTNSKDAVTARCFTLLHEVAHVLLRSGGLCDFHERRSQERIDRVEVFCNRAAAAALVPAPALEAQLEAEGFRSRREWTDAQLAGLARRFRVSWEVILLRLLAIGRTTQAFYDQWKAGRGEPPPEPSGFLTPVDRAIMRNGRLFTRLVVSAYSSGKLTLVDASYLLGGGPQHIGALTERAFDTRYVA